MRTTRTKISRLRSRAARLSADVDVLVTSAAISGEEWAVLDRLRYASTALHTAWRELEGALLTIRSEEEDEL